MNKRRWIIQKYMRRCSNHSRCVGYDKANAKVVVVDAEKGIVETTCRECGQKETHQADKFKERRPCPRCRDVFDFTISLWKSPGSDEVTEHWSLRCKICEMEVSAASHLAEVVKYNHEAKVRSCPHGNREKIPDDDDRVGYWICRDCTSRVGAPSAAEGTFRLSGLLWRAHAAEVSSEK